MAKKLAVPHTILDVTDDWLRDTLAKTIFNTSFSQITYESIGEEYGFASKIYRIECNSAEKQQSIVLKLWDISTNAGIGEVLFYQHFQDVPIRIPQCYGASIDTESARAYLLLEDIQNARQGDVLQPVNLDVAKSMASDLAKLHSYYLEHSMLNELEWISDVSVWTTSDDWIDSRRKSFLERFPNKLSGTAHQLLDSMELVPQFVNQVLDDAPKTLLHGDFHLDNLLFEKQSKAVFLDWSRVLKGPQVYNLAELLFRMTNLDNFNQVIHVYITEFNRQSEDELELQQFENQIGAEMLRLFARTTLGIARWQPDSERGVQIIEDGLNKANKIVDFWYKRKANFLEFLDSELE